MCEGIEGFASVSVSVFVSDVHFGSDLMCIGIERWRVIFLKSRWRWIRAMFYNDQRSMCKKRREENESRSAHPPMPRKNIGNHSQSSLLSTTQIPTRTARRRTRASTRTRTSRRTRTNTHTHTDTHPNSQRRQHRIMMSKSRSNIRIRPHTSSIINTRRSRDPKRKRHFIVAVVFVTVVFTRC